MVLYQKCGRKRCESMNEIKCVQFGNWDVFCGEIHMNVAHKWCFFFAISQKCTWDLNLAYTSCGWSIEVQQILICIISPTQDAISYKSEHYWTLNMNTK